MNAPSHSTTGRSRRTTLLCLAGLHLGCTLAYGFLNGLTPAPFIFHDELIFAELARGFTFHGGMHWDGRPIPYPSWGYILMIKPLFQWITMPQAHRLAQWLNALLMGATVWPAFGLAAEASGPQRARAAAGLTALLPAISYSAHLMAESLFFPMTTLAFWLGLRAMNRPTVTNRLLAGFGLGLTFHVKPQGLLLPGIFALAVVAAALLEGSPSDRSHRPLRRFAQVGRHGLTAGAWAAVVAVRLLEAAWIERLDDLLSLEALLGAYGPLGVRETSAESVVRIPVLMGCLVTWAVGCGLLPAGRLIAELPAAARGRLPPGPRNLVVLAACANLLWLWMVVRHTNTEVRIHERYFMLGYPLLLALFCMPTQRRVRPGRRAFMAGVAAKAGFFCVAALVLHALSRIIKWYIPGDNPSLATLFLFLHRRQIPLGLLVILAGLALVAGGAILFCGRTFRHRWLAVALFLVALNVARWTMLEQFVEPEWGAPRASAVAIAEHLPAGDHLCILQDRLDPELLLRAAFFCEGSVVYLAGHTDPLWFADPVEADSIGALADPPRHGQWLLADPTWRFNQPPVAHYPRGSLYRLGRHPSFRLTSPTPSNARSGPRPRRAHDAPGIEPRD